MSDMFKANSFVENIRYDFRVFKTIFSIVLKQIMFGKERRKWKDYLFQKFCIYDEKYIKSLKHKKSILIFVNALEILGMNKFCQVLKENFNDYNLIIACDNFDAYEMSQKLRIGDLVIYTPWDFGFLGRKLMWQFNPNSLLFVAKIFHPVIINQFKKHCIFSGLVSGIFSHEIANDKVFQFNFARLMANKTFEKLDYVSMINDECKNDLLDYVKREDIYIMGNIRQDVSHAATTAEEKKNFYSQMQLKHTDLIIIAAATRNDEELILDAYKLVLEQIPEAKLILIPRHIERAQEIIELIKNKELKCVKLSQVQQKPEQIIVGDVLVELAKMYSIANVIIFARTFLPIGGNANILEPAYHGKPIIFGNFLKLSRSDISHIIKEHPQIEVINSEQLAQSVIYFLRNKKISKVVGGKFKEATYEGEKIAMNNAEFIIKKLNDRLNGK